MKASNGVPLFAAAAVLLALMTAGAHAAFDFMPTGGRTPQPVGHYEFCAREPAECARNAGPAGPVKLTRDLWATIIDVNNQVNSSVIPRTDMELWNVMEHWSYPDIYGDCEDYVLEMRRLLVKAGVPAASLLITVVLQPNGEGHAVLTVSTSMGDFILDNLEPRVLHWSETGYQYLKRQSASHSGQWVNVNDGRSIPVGSVSSRR